ncbi:MAG: KEOPS complex subunit Pcc1 [Promethearchaeati archaeon SRVP18_Atabeyarchaeia-1]
MKKLPDVWAIRATLELETRTETQELVLAVMRPEFARQNSTRSNVVTKASSHGVIIKVKARDLSSFRSSVTSILRLISVILEMQKIIRNEAR